MRILVKYKNIYTVEYFYIYRDKIHKIRYSPQDPTNTLRYIMYTKYSQGSNDKENPIYF